jgi:hypothetical protein
MNRDVARLIMDPSTTSNLGGIVTIDHYVSNPNELSSAVVGISTKSDGQVVLGEFGAPIPDINGPMTDEQQSNWLSTALSDLVNQPQLVGLNYWVDTGGSTALWNSDGSPREAVAVLTKFYKQDQISGTATDESGNRISNLQISYLGRNYSGDNQGNFQLPYLSDKTEIIFSADKYKPLTLLTGDLIAKKQVVLEKTSLSLWDYLALTWLKIKGFLF